MRKIDTSAILGFVQEMPVKAGHWEHLQDGFKEIIQALLSQISSLPNNSSTVYVLFGCENTSTPPNYNISAGAVYYQGEIFLVDAASFTASVGAVAILETTQYSALDGGGNQKGDPVLFTDLTNRDVLDIRKIKFVDGNSLTADFVDEFSDLIYIQSDWVTIGDPGAPAFASGWAAGSSIPVQFMKEINGFINIRGFPVRSSGSGTTIFTLPVGFRPPYIIDLPIVDATANATGIIQIATNGDVIIPGVVTGNTNVIGTVRFRMT